MTAPSPRKAAATRVRLLNAAERIFAAQGYEGASLRTITRRAGVNLAAVNYHFSSKRGLWIEVMARRLRPLNEERLRRLAAIRARANGQPPAVEDICAAFLEPLVQKLYDGSRPPRLVVQMVARVFSEPVELRRELDRLGLGQVSSEFREALREALPGQTPLEVDWKYYFLACAMLGALARQGRQPGVQGPMDTRDVGELVRRLQPFVCAGFRAPPRA